MPRRSTRRRGASSAEQEREQEQEQEQEQTQEQRGRQQTVKDRSDPSHDGDQDRDEDEDEDEYEVARRRNIQSNRALLEKLGLRDSDELSALGLPRKSLTPKKRSPSSSVADEDEHVEVPSLPRASRRGRASGAGRASRAALRNGAAAASTSQEPLRRSSRRRAVRDDGGDRPSSALSAAAASPGIPLGRLRSISRSLTSEQGADDEGFEAKKRPKLKKLPNPRPPRTARERSDLDGLDDGSTRQRRARGSRLSDEGGERDGGNDDGSEGEDDDEDIELPRQPLPKRRAPPRGKRGHGTLVFEASNRHFQPNLTPEEMLRGGIFGGTAFRAHRSPASLGGAWLPGAPKETLAEFPPEWSRGLDLDLDLRAKVLRPERNRFGVKAGQTLEDWERSGWISRQDPRGWFQWYFRFYLGRRTRDDARQIGRWLKACGPAGRFKKSLVTKIAYAGAKWDDERVSPVVRQTLWQWAYCLTEADYEAYLPGARGNRR